MFNGFNIVNSIKNSRLIFFIYNEYYVTLNFKIGGLRRLRKYKILFICMVLLFSFVPFTQAASFKDVSKSHTFYDEIHYLVDKEIIAGYVDGTFKPTQVVTRAQAATMIGRALGLNGTKGKTQFPDVASDSVASGYIQAAAEKGIIQGFADGTFKPNAQVTRGQLAIFLTRAFELTKSSSVTFSDVSSSSAAYPYIGYLVAGNITLGYDDGTFRPNSAVTRGQFAAFMTRTLHYINNEANTGYTVSTYEQEVLRLVNIERAKKGISPVTLHVKLSEVARLKSQDMKDNNYFSHTSPTYGSPFNMMTQFGISYTAAAENIALGYSTPQAVVTGWMNSDGHRRNIMNANYTHIGIGHVADGNYWTQMFMRQ